MRYTFPIIAINRDGNTHLLYTVQEVLNFVYSTRQHRWGGYNVGQYWTDYASSWDRYKNNGHHNEWILRDDRGCVVDWNEFVPPRENWKNRKGVHTFRDGPVPHRCGRRGCTRFDAPRKRHGGRGMILRDEAHRAENGGRIRFGRYLD